MQSEWKTSDTSWHICIKNNVSETTRTREQKNKENHKI